MKIDFQDKVVVVTGAAQGNGAAYAMVNNAGIVIRSALNENNPIQAWESTMGVNLDGPFFMTLSFMEQLKATKGSVLNIASVQTFISTPNSVAYTASKGGVGQLTKGLACEFAAYGVRVNAIAPGVFDTPMTEATQSDPGKLEKLLAHVPMKRTAQPEELNGAALFLCSEHASYITGAVLPVDGGFLAS
jgi:NAD(P)-dependent dehydrogenase (short-subunit alcohol dehydrogenase family)